MHKLLPFDGLWLDMNEFSNFCNGVCYQKQAPAKSIKTNLKYTPTGKDLEWQNTVPLDAQHKNGEYQLDTHSITGISEIKVTNEWFTNSLKTRTFIIERSASVGLGKWASRWLGDNFSDAKFMKLSVSGTMLSNIFGIPLVGSDICGFLGDTTEELCTKWHFVGAFYPFSRNHNGGFDPQEPYIFSKPAMLAMTEAIKIKYALVRYYYTELFALSTKDGEGTFYKPMLFEFPEDYNTTRNIEENVMLGSALKLSINSGNLSEVTTEFYFPQGTWCRLLGNTRGENCFVVGELGVNKYYPSNLTDYQLHLRMGYTVPLQDTLSSSAKAFNTTKDLQNQYVDFHVLGLITDSQSGKWVSRGRYINDDGLSLNITGNYNSYILYSSFDGADTLTVSFGMDAQATLHLVPETGCYLVNQNDLLGGMFFYNA
jgi:alpha-glucosidase (family GH31 glycosyl hydrolase)